MSKRTVQRAIRFSEVEDRLISRIATERNASVSSVVRWAINVAARQEEKRLERVNKRDGASIRTPAPSL